MSRGDPGPVTEDYIFKVGLVGDMDVGKRTYAKKATLNIWSDSYLDALGAMVTKFQVTKRGKRVHITSKLMIWDISARVRTPSLRASYLNGVSGAIVMADATRQETVENTARWASLLRDTLGPIPLVFILNKVDLVSPVARERSMRIMTEQAKKFRGRVYAMSVLRNDGKTLLQPLRTLAREIIKRTV